MVLASPRQESNLHQRNRNPLSYPLDYEGKWFEVLESNELIPGFRPDMLPDGCTDHLSSPEARAHTLDTVHQLRVLAPGFEPELIP